MTKKNIEENTPLLEIDSTGQSLEAGGDTYLKPDENSIKQVQTMSKEEIKILQATIDETGPLV